MEFHLFYVYYTTIMIKRTFNDIQVNEVIGTVDLHFF